MNKQGIELHLHTDVSGEINGRLDGEFIVVDIETTGLNPQIDKITEITAYKINRSEIVDTFKSFVNPEIEIPGGITALTGITNEMVRDADKSEVVLKTFLEFCGDAVIVAHNAEFDLNFIKHNLDLIGIEYNPTIIDTLALSRGLFPELKSFRLNEVCKALGVELQNHHRAENDAEATVNVFIKLCEKLKEKGVSNIQDIKDKII